MRVICKYDITLDRETVLVMPKGARVLSLQNHRARVGWAGSDEYKPCFVCAPCLKKLPEMD
jgi:hypothetical protein